MLLLTEAFPNKSAHNMRRGSNGARRPHLRGVVVAVWATMSASAAAALTSDAAARQHITPADEAGATTAKDLSQSIPLLIF